MNEPLEDRITQLLVSLRDPSIDRVAAGDRLYDGVYGKMRSMAHLLMRHENASHTLQPTALVHEAYLKLVDQSQVEWNDRAHFYATAARVMRHILVDHARRKNRSKRGGGWRRITLDESLGISKDPYLDTISLDMALTRLFELDDRMGKVVEMRIFAGLTAKEIAEVLGVSKRTVDGDWLVAKRWLADELAA